MTQVEKKHSGGSTVFSSEGQKQKRRYKKQQFPENTEQDQNTGQKFLMPNENPIIECAARIAASHASEKKCLTNFFKGIGLEKAIAFDTGWTRTKIPPEENC